MTEQPPRHGRSVVVTPELLRAVVRDGVRFAVTRRSMRITWILAGVGVLLALASLVIMAAFGAELDPVFLVLPLLILAIPTLLLGAFFVTIRRAEHAAMPVGTSIAAEVGDDALHVESVQGASSIRYAAYRAVHAYPETVVLELAGGSSFQSIPRELIDDAELERLRRAIGSRSR